MEARKENVGIGARADTKLKDKRNVLNYTTLNA